MLKKYIKSLMKTLYLLPIRTLGYGKRKKNENVVFLLSFPSTSEYILDELVKKYNKRLIICYTKEAKFLADTFKEKGIRTYSLDSLLDIYARIVPALNSAKVILCDNYFAILAGFNFENEVKVVQLWHANGAIKAFGAGAKYTEHVTETDRNRYKKVYDRFTHIVVSSEEMANIFCDSYLNKYSVLPFGYPVTDLYFREYKSSTTVFANQHLNEKIALYAPTYRDQIEVLGVDLNEIQRRFPEGWQLYVRLHPHDHKLKEQLAHLPNVKQIPEDIPLSTVFGQIDCLITDYSSIPFEYSLARKQGKIIYYCYDFEQYENTVGLQKNFEEWAAPYIVTGIDELIAAIKEDDTCTFDKFNALWNTFVQGHAADQLIEWIDKQYED